MNDHGPYLAKYELLNHKVISYPTDEQSYKSLSREEERDIFHSFICDLSEENRKMKDDIKFCLHSINQERKMSRDERTRSEMTSCYEILKGWVK